MKLAMTLLMVCAVTVFAQAQSGPPQPPTADVQAFLSLTDAQVQSLQQLRQTQRTTVQPLMQQLMTKQQSLQNQLASGASAATLGTLLQDIEALQKQIQQAQTTYQAQALNLLTADQKTKLQALQDAAKLQPAIREATSLGLMSPPAGQGGRGGGRGFGAGGGAGFGPARGGGPTGPARPRR